MACVAAMTARTRALLTGALVLCAAVVLGILLLQGSGSTGATDTAAGATDASTQTVTSEPTVATSPTPVLPTAVATSPTPTPTPAPPTPPTAEASEREPDASHTPSSGLPTIAESDLPPEAWDTMQLIYDGGPFPYRQDDETFFNREGILPDRERGYYREYTVETPGWHDRGARRIVAGADGDLYYTEDHYDSFEQIMEGR